MTKERKALPYSAVIAVLAVLVVAAAVGIYLHYCKPSQRDILSGPQPPVAENMQPMLPAKPLSALPEPDQLRFADALRDAVATIKPDYHVDEERLYTYTGGWDAGRKLTGQYLGGDSATRCMPTAKRKSPANPSTTSSGDRLAGYADSSTIASSRRLESGRK